MEDNPMFRYLLKYVGKYRVLTELTTDTHDFVRDSEGNIHSDYDELYIECNRGAKVKHSYKEDILGYWTDKISIFKSTKKKFDDNNIKYELEDAGDEFIIYFNASDINKVAKLVGMKTTGKKINPYDEVNIPNRIKKEYSTVHAEPTIISSYKIPNEDLKLYYTAVAPLPDRISKNAISKQTLSEFDNEIKKIKGDDFDPEKERNKINIKPREFIHYIGLWNQYIKFVELGVEKYLKCQK